MITDAKFTTHTGETVTGDTLQKALNEVAKYWRALGLAIRKENLYASHVTEAEKEHDLQKRFSEATQIESGNIVSFTIWQLVNTELTGKCVGFFNDTKK